MPPSSGHQFQVSSHSLPLRLADISMRQTDNCLPTTKLTRDNCFAVGRSRDEAKRRDVISQPPSQTHRAHTLLQRKHLLAELHRLQSRRQELVWELSSKVKRILLLIVSACCQFCAADESTNSSESSIVGEGSLFAATHAKPAYCGDSSLARTRN